MYPSLESHVTNAVVNIMDKAKVKYDRLILTYTIMRVINQLVTLAIMRRLTTTGQVSTDFRTGGRLRGARSLTQSTV